MLLFLKTKWPSDEGDARMLLISIPRPRDSMTQAAIATTGRELFGGAITLDLPTDYLDVRYERLPSTRHWARN